MTEKERLDYIERVSKQVLSIISNSTYNMIPSIINEVFDKVEAISLMSYKDDGFIEANAEHFEELDRQTEKKYLSG